MNDLAGLCNKASDAASKAVAVSDELHIELAHVRIKEIWPNAKSWDRQYEAEDGVGSWYLTEVKLEDDTTIALYPSDATTEHEGVVEEVNSILGDIWSQEDHGTINRVSYDGATVAQQWHVVEYEVTREYGGPEEGGWWYDNYQKRDGCYIAMDEPTARLLAKAATDRDHQQKVENGERNRFSQIGTPDIIWVAEQVVGEHETKEAPRFE